MPSAQALRAGRAVIELGMPSGKVEKALKSLEQRARKIGDAFKAVGKIGLATGGAVSGAFAGLAKQFASVGDQLNKMAARTGASVEALSELKFAAQQSGSSIGAVEKGMQGMARTLLSAERGLTTATDNLAELGLSLADLRGKSPDKQFETLAQRISEIEDPVKRSAIAMRIFGKSGTELLPLFTNGARGIQELRAEARDLNITMSTENAQAAADLTDALGRATEQIKTIAIEIGAAVAGPITDFLQGTRETISNAIDWTRNNRELIRTVAKIGTTLAATSAAVYGIGTAFTVASRAVKGFQLAVAFATAHPIIAALTLAAGAFTAIALAAERARRAASDVGDQINRIAQEHAKREGKVNEGLFRLRELERAAELTKAERKEVLALAFELRKLYGISRPEDGGLSISDDGRVQGLALAEAQIAAARRVSDVPRSQLQAEEAQLRVVAGDLEGAAKLREQIAAIEEAVKNARVIPQASPDLPPLPPAVTPDQLPGPDSAAGRALINLARDAAAAFSEGIVDGAQGLVELGESVRDRIAAVKDAQAFSVNRQAATQAVFDARFATSRQAETQERA